jgi:hypothetical protein
VHALLAGLELRLGHRTAAREHALAAEQQETRLGVRAWQARTAALVAATA